MMGEELGLRRGPLGKLVPQHTCDEAVQFAAAAP